MLQCERVLRCPLWPFYGQIVAQEAQIEITTLWDLFLDVGVAMLDTLVVVPAACFQPLRIDCPSNIFNIIFRKSCFVLARCAELPAEDVTVEFEEGTY